MVPQMPQQMPPEMIQALAGQMGAGPPQGGPGGPPEPSAQNMPDPLQATQEVIQDLHTLIGVLPDPNHTQIATQCLFNLTKIQRELMTGAQQGGGGPA